MATCTAHGHPDCTVTCQNGCAALYVEPNGPCYTFCSDSAAVSIGPDGTFTIQINDMPAARLGDILAMSLDPSIQSALKSSSALISLSEQGITLKELAAAIQRII